MNLSYQAVKLPNFKTIDEKLPELESRVSHSLDQKLVSRKKLLKVLASPQVLLPLKDFYFKMRCQNFFLQF